MKASGNPRIHESKELMYGIFCHAFGAILEWLNAEFHHVGLLIASVCCVSVGMTLWFSFYRSRVSRQGELDFQRHPNPWQRKLVRYLVILFILLLSGSGTMLLAKYGFISCIAIKGTFCAHPGEQLPDEEILVLLFAGGMTPIAYTTVDKEHKFQFTGLKHRTYHMMAIHLGTNSVEIKEFSKDLRHEDLWDSETSLREELDMEHYTITNKGKCFFDTGNSDLDSEAGERVDDLRSSLPSTPYRLLIMGHADEIGGKKRNIELSKERAENVYEKLTDLRNNNRTILAFFGSDRPAIPNGSANALYQNRRTEILVLVRSKP